MGSTSLLEKDKKELAKQVHGLAWLGVSLINYTKGGLVVINGYESSLVSKVKGEKIKTLSRFKGKYS